MTPDKRLLSEAEEPVADDSVDDERLARIRERPDGYHWIDVEGRQEFGPFESLEEALADMDGASEEGFEQADIDEAQEQGLDFESDIGPYDEDELSRGA